jgi:ketosteroid isomerase-like protein
MSKPHYLLITGMVLLMAACGNQPKENTATADETTAIKIALTNMWDAIEKHDIDRYAGYVHPNFTQYGETDSVLLKGKGAEVAATKSWMDRSTNVHTEMIDPKVTVNGNTAWIVYYWADKGWSDGEAFTSHGKSTRIFVKENGQWLCIHGHYTLLP